MKPTTKGIWGSLAIAMYADEPCRICGKLIIREDIEADAAVFAGYSRNSKSRAAHRKCWDSKKPKAQWVYPLDAIPTSETA